MSPSAPAREPLDLLLAAVGAFHLAFVPVAFTTDYVVGAASPWLDFAVAGVATVPFAAWYWWTGRSLGDLGMTFFWVVALGIPVGAAVVVTLGVTERSLEPGSTAEYLVRMGVVVVVYALAQGLARRGVRLFGDGAESSAEDT